MFAKNGFNGVTTLTSRLNFGGVHLSMRTPFFLLAGLLPVLASQAQAASLSPSSLTLTPGQVATVTATSIKGSLSIANSNPGVASAALASTKITVSAIKAGSTTVTVRDKSGSKSLKVTVNAPPMTVLPESLSLTVGQSASVNVSNPNGSVRATSSNSSIATAILRNNVVTVQGKVAGSATITIKDSKTTRRVAVKVTGNGGGGGVTNSEGRLLASQCFQCHNAKGGSTGFDRITGESVNEIVSEMKEMQAKAASEPEIMHSQAMIYTDAEITALAKYLSSLSGSTSASSKSRDGGDKDDD